MERMMTGGQAINVEKIENFPGFPDGISGAQMSALLQDQAIKYGLDIKLSEVARLQKRNKHWSVGTYDGDLTAKVVIVAGGSTLRRLGVPGEKELHGSGVSYCATCDGAFFSDQVIAVVGGGDSALDEAVTLTKFASKVIIIQRGDQFRGQKILQDRVLSNPKVEILWNTAINSIIGKSQVDGLGIKDMTSGKTSCVDLSGVFIYVGLDPNTQYLSKLIPLDNGGHIPTDIWMRTPLPGLMAAGDIRQGSAAQFVSAAGDGATAAISAYRYIDTSN